MSLRLIIADQVLKVDDARDATEAVVHKYDAFLNLLCGESYSFQRDAVRSRFDSSCRTSIPTSIGSRARTGTPARPSANGTRTLDAYLARCRCGIGNRSRWI